MKYDKLDARIETWLTAQAPGTIFRTVQVRRGTKCPDSPRARGHLCYRLEAAVEDGRLIRLVKGEQAFQVPLPPQILSNAEVILATVLVQLGTPRYVTHYQLKRLAPILNGEPIGAPMLSLGYVQVPNPTAIDPRWPMQSGNGTPAYVYVDFDELRGLVRELDG